jgi:hypothetical protein
MRRDERRDDADRRLHLLPRVRELPRSAESKGRGLLRFLFVRIGQVPARATVLRLLPLVT